MKVGAYMSFMINGHNVFVIVLVTFLTSLLLIPIIKKVSIHVNAMDYPNSPRKIHKKPMPRLGGVAISLSFMLGYMLFAKSSTMMLSILIPNSETAVEIFATMFGTFLLINVIRYGAVKAW